MWNIIMHINYCEQGQTIDEACKKASSWGFDGIEFRRRSKGGVSDEKYLESIANAAERYGLKQIILGSPGLNLMSDNAVERKKEIEDTISYYKLAGKYVKLNVCNTFTGLLKNTSPDVSSADFDKHGSFVASDNQWIWASEGFAALADGTEDLGIRFAFETHMNYIHDKADSAIKLINLINRPNVGINLDYGNQVYFKNTPKIKDTISSIGSKLFYVHLKNSIGLGGMRMPTALAEGEINHREYLKVLKDTGYKGPICIEAPRSGDREWYAQQDLAYIKAVIEDISK